MTLDEAIELANQGDAFTMGSIGHYYYEKNDYQNAFEWFAKAADAGLVDAMPPAASLALLLSITERSLSGWESITDADVRTLDKAIEWDRLAQEAGFESDSTDDLYRERALCAFEASKKDGSNISPLRAIDYLKDAYARQNRTPEVEVCLAMALGRADPLTADDARLRFDLLKHCVSFSEEDVPDINIGTLEAALGMCYLRGKGCVIDENAAHDCFVRAEQKGFDCSDMLRQFRKKLFGGYALRR